MSDQQHILDIRHKINGGPAESPAHSPHYCESCGTAFEEGDEIYAYLSKHGDHWVIGRVYCTDCEHRYESNHSLEAIVQCRAGKPRRQHNDLHSFDLLEPEVIEFRKEGEQVQTRVD